MDAYSTNAGILFIFESKDKNVLYISSDATALTNNVFEPSNNDRIYIGASFLFDRVRYLVREFGLYKEDDMEENHHYISDGIKYTYTFVLRIMLIKENVVRP